MCLQMGYIEDNNLSTVVPELYVGKIKINLKYHWERKDCFIQYSTNTGGMLWRWQG